MIRDIIMEEQNLLIKNMGIKEVQKTILKQVDGLMKRDKIIVSKFDKMGRRISYESNNIKIDSIYLADLLLVEKEFSKKYNKENISSYQYDDKDRLLSIYYNGKKSEEYIYDDLGYTVNSYLSDLLSISRYNHKNQLLEYKNNLLRKEVIKYSYNRNKLTTEETNSYIKKYIYNNGNLVRVKVTDRDTNNTYSESIIKYQDGRIIQNELTANTKTVYIYSYNGLLDTITTYRYGVIVDKHIYSYSK